MDPAWNKSLTSTCGATVDILTSSPLFCSFMVASVRLKHTARRMLGRSIRECGSGSLPSCWLATEQNHRSVEFDSVWNEGTKQAPGDETWKDHSIARVSPHGSDRDAVQGVAGGCAYCHSKRSHSRLTFECRSRAEHCSLDLLDLLGRLVLSANTLATATLCGSAIN